MSVNTLASTDSTIRTSQTQESLIASQQMVIWALRFSTGQQTTRQFRRAASWSPRSGQRYIFRLLFTNDFAGRMMYGIQTEAKHQFLRDLSRNISRSKHQRAVSGNLPIGRTPYGYDKEFLDAAGNRVALVSRTAADPPRKQRGWNTRLVRNELEAETVRRIFTMYDETDIGLRGIAMRLNAEGIPSPKQRKWSGTAIRHVIVNPVYRGDYVYGRHPHGKYHFTTKEGVQTRDRSRQERVKFQAEEKCIVHESHHDAIVTPELWRRVQRKLTARGNRTSPRTEPDRHLLTGLLVCGHCGKTMYGRRRQGTRRPYYICTTYSTFGRDACKRYTIDEAALVECLIASLKREILGDKQLEQLTAKVRSRLTKLRRTVPKQLARKRSEIEKLTRQIDQAAERMLTDPEDVSDVLIPKIRDLKSRCATLKREVAEASQHVKTSNDIEAEIGGIVETAQDLAKEITDAEPARRRELFRRFTPRIVMKWETPAVPPGRRLTHTLSSIEVTTGAKRSSFVRPDTFALHVVSPRSVISNRRRILGGRGSRRAGR